MINDVDFLAALRAAADAVAARDLIVARDVAVRELGGVVMPMDRASRIGPTVWLVGDVEHPDFAEAVALVRATADVSAPGAAGADRGGAESAGSDCGCARSSGCGGVRRWRESSRSWGVGAKARRARGRPAAGVPRLYWYEFPSWWRRQIALRAAGRCPEWARVDDFGLRIADCGLGLSNARIVIETAGWESAAALADVLQTAGAETIWVRPGQKADLMRRHGWDLGGRAVRRWRVGTTCGILRETRGK